MLQGSLGLSKLAVVAFMTVVIGHEPFRVLGRTVMFYPYGLTYATYPVPFTVTGATLAEEAQDPPQPDAVPFCEMNAKNSGTDCTCATAYDGTLCKSDEPLPNFCKKMCGHAKDCHCCGLHK